MLLKEKCFYSGRDSGGILPVLDEGIFEPYTMSTTIFLKIAQNIYSTPIFYKINPDRILLQLQTILHNLNLEIKEVFNIDNQIRTHIQNSPLHNIPIDLMSLCKMRQEYIINNFKRIIDELTMLFCIKHDLHNFSRTSKIKILSIGGLISKGDSALKDKIKTELSYDKFECIFKTINDLHNAFKHDILMNEARSMIGPYNLTVTAFYAPYGNLEIDNIIFLNHSFAQIIMGFDDFICNISGYNIFSGIHSYNQYKNNSMTYF
jgi:hypothetical protein